MNELLQNKTDSGEKHDVTYRICKFCNWSYDPARQEIFTREKITNHVKIYPWPSLDAIYDAESKLSPAQFTKYTNLLCDITYNEEYPDPNVEQLIHLSLKSKLLALIQLVNSNPSSIN